MNYSFYLVSGSKVFKNRFSIPPDKSLLSMSILVIFSSVVFNYFLSSLFLTLNKLSEMLPTNQQAFLVISFKTNYRLFFYGSLIP
jgi:hypothetical protein